jgi:glutathione synthase/RimK-type ligase-like ATP-grasp enzyme
MKYTIVIYFDIPGKMGYPFDRPHYFASYRDFSAFCAARETQVYFCRDNSYLGNMQFTNGWRFEGDELIDVDTTITADVVYIKSLHVGLKGHPDDLMVNHPEFDTNGRDKWLTYEAFSHFMPVTYKINNDNWQEVRDAIPSDQVVLKPILGTNGDGIVITSKQDLDFPSLNITNPYIAQEFIDSSNGIPGICEGYHDLRVIMFNGEPKLSFVRLPLQGNILSNIAQGGSAIVVPINQVPSEILDMARAIDAHYGAYPHTIYTCDFFMSNEGRPYLIETNTRPGITAHTPEYAQEYYHNLHHALTQAAEQKKATRKSL